MWFPLPFFRIFHYNRDVILRVDAREEVRLNYHWMATMMRGWKSGLITQQVRNGFRDKYFVTCFVHFLIPTGSPRQHTTKHTRTPHIVRRFFFSFLFYHEVVQARVARRTDVRNELGRVKRDGNIRRKGKTQTEKNWCAPCERAFLRFLFCFIFNFVFLCHANAGNIMSFHLWEQIKITIIRTIFLIITSDLKRFRVKLTKKTMLSIPSAMLTKKKKCTIRFFVAVDRYTAVNTRHRR